MQTSIRKKITSGELHEYVLTNVARDPGDHDGMRRGFENILENIACGVGSRQWPLVGKRLKRYKNYECGESWT